MGAEAGADPMGCRVRRLAAGLVAAVLTALALPAAASAFSTVTMFSEQGDYIGGGLERVYHPGNASLDLSGSASDLTVSVSGGNHGDSFGLEFAAPAGQKLEQGGVYVGAQRAAFREAGRPGIDINGSGRGCNKISGSFEVLDLATDNKGKVTRLGLVFEQHCEGGRAALFGEVRYGYGAPAGPVAIPTHVRWPGTELGAPGLVEPVTLLAWGAPVTVRGASLAGADAEHFSIRSDECSARTLQPGESCQVFVRPSPTQPGTHRAALHFSTQGSAVTEVKLDGHAGGGRTRFVMESDSGDYIGDGRNMTYTPANASIDVSGNRRFARIAVEADDGASWEAEFEAGSGDILAPGRTYSNATRYPFNNGGNGMNVGGSGRGCNRLDGQFTVNEARYTPEGALRFVSISYEQHCEGEQPALRGVAEVRAGDTTPPAPWTQPLRGAPWTPPPDRDAAPGATPNDSTTQPTRASTPLAARTKAEPPKLPVLSSADRALCGSRVRGARWRRGTAASDRLRASGAKEVLVMGAGNDRAWGRGGPDCLSGGTGNDRLDGGSGSDVILGGPGSDRLTGGAGRDLIVCGSGKDVAYAGRGDRTRGCERVVRR